MTTSGGVDRTTLYLNFDGQQPDIEAMKRLYGKFDDMSDEGGVSVLAESIIHYGFHDITDDTVNDTVNGAAFENVKKR